MLESCFTDSSSTDAIKPGFSIVAALMADAIRPEQITEQVSNTFAVNSVTSAVAFRPEAAVESVGNSFTIVTSLLQDLAKRFNPPAEMVGNSFSVVDASSTTENTTIWSRKALHQPFH